MLRTQAQGTVAVIGDGEVAEVSAIVPASETAILVRAAAALGQELRESLAGFTVTVAHSRRTDDPVDVYRAGKEALLAVNVAEAEGLETLAFEDTGAYRLLLPAMSEDPGELERFYEETVAPLSAYDEQYETELVATVEAYLANDGNVTPTAETMYTHRHTIRYRLERVKELSRPRHVVDGGPREAEPRPQGDARAGHRPAARPGAGAGRGGRQGAQARRGEVGGATWCLGRGAGWARCDGGSRRPRHRVPQRSPACARTAGPTCAPRCRKRRTCARPRDTRAR